MSLRKVQEVYAQLRLKEKEIQTITQEKAALLARERQNVLERGTLNLQIEELRQSKMYSLELSGQEASYVRDAVQNARHYAKGKEAEILQGLLDALDKLSDLETQEPIKQPPVPVTPKTYEEAYREVSKQ